LLGHAFGMMAGHAADRIAIWACGRKVHMERPIATIGLFVCRFPAIGIAHDDCPITDAGSHA
jgi:hypothetical protein